MDSIPRHTTRSGRWCAMDSKWHTTRNGRSCAMDSKWRQAHYGVVAQRRSRLRIHTDCYCTTLSTKISQGVVTISLDQAYRRPMRDWYGPLTPLPKTGGAILQEVC